MKAKIYTKWGPFYILIEEEEIKDIDELFKKWRDVYAVVYDDDGNIVFEDFVD
ncbi:MULTISPECIES: hypothetical protein [Metallosphaera]|uniref:hypothetical protein n=1 Tax=Metallosphaera TaxID=41980 RepID=UPI001F0628A4|nr:hypothetical protein [Metallosphaera sedula]MCH1771530.1 hypothetical protein [Metallosphaera sedula]